MKNFDETSFLADISSVDWNLIIQRSADLDSAVENWTNMLSLIIEKHAPLRQRRVSDRYCPWITSELKTTMRSRDKLKKSAVKHGSALLMQAYRHIRNRVNSLNTKLKKAYFSQKIADCQGNMKETWNTINKLINKRSKTTNISSLMVDEECLTKSSEIADSMNDYFCNIGSKLSSKIPNLENPLLNGDYSINEKHARFHFQTIRPDELSKIMNKFKTSQSSGIDGISCSFLKIAMPVLAPSLCSIFNVSISRGCFPGNWKIARVSPIYKDGSTEDRSNYRPISVLPVVSRLFEKIVFDQVYNYFTENEFSTQTSRVSDYFTPY